MFHNDVRFSSVYHKMYCCKFLTLSSQTLSHIHKCIRRCSYKVFIEVTSQSSLQPYSSWTYRKTSKNWDTPEEKNIITPKMEFWCFVAVRRPKDADGMANNVDPDQTAPVDQSDLGLHCLH